MKHIATRTVKKTLRNLGFRPAARGDSTGHECWVHTTGVTCRPPLRKKDTPIPYLYSLGQRLENIGICTRRDFFTLVQGR